MIPIKHFEGNYLHYVQTSFTLSITRKCMHADNMTFFKLNDFKCELYEVYMCAC